MLNRVPEVNADQRRALELLSDAGLNGCTGATLLSHGFSIEMLADLIRDGLATTHREPLMSAGQRQIDVPACVLRTRGGGRWDNATLRTRAENAIAGYLANPRRSFLPIIQSTAVPWISFYHRDLTWLRHCVKNELPAYRHGQFVDLGDCLREGPGASDNARIVVFSQIRDHGLAGTEVDRQAIDRDSFSTTASRAIASIVWAVA
jgi:hypothetical protein